MRPFLYFIWDASDRSQVFAGSTTSAMRLSHHIPVSRQLASKLLAVASQSLTILPDWVRRSQPTRLSMPTSTYHLVVCLVGTGSAVLVDQTTDGSIRFETTPATCPRRYGDQPFSVAMAQEWCNGPRRLCEHDDDDDDSCISGDIALRIQHDISRRHTKTSKPDHPPQRFLTSGITLFSLGHNSPNNKLKTPLRN